jgi:hypothetical protein
MTRPRKTAEEGGPLDRLLRRARAARHERAARDILWTPPIATRGDDEVVVFSMIGTRVLLPYLVAVKSFLHALGRGRVEILDDGTLTDADRAVLATHLDTPRIHRFANVTTGACPTGGCWERLTVLLALVRDAYVIQLDSDTVTLGDVPEVRAAIAGGRGFTLLGGTDGEALGRMTCSAFRAAVHPEGPAPIGQHIQNQIESRLDRLPDAATRFYVRGCAGFAGFPRASATRAEAEAFSQAAEALTGRDVWHRWGSEQIASNFLVANTPDPVLLPYARYYNFWDDERPEAAFAHFVGSHRFTGDAYLRATRRAIATLGRA